jgi:hypothetical protein
VFSPADEPDLFYLGILLYLNNEDVPYHWIKLDFHDLDTPRGD